MINEVRYPNMNTSIREWYVNEYPSDDLGREIFDTVTFSDLDLCLASYGDVYGVLGVDDSIVRERVFQGLSLVLGCDYDEIYYQWLNCAA